MKKIFKEDSWFFRIKDPETGEEKPVQLNSVKTIAAEAFLLATASGLAIFGGCFLACFTAHMINVLVRKDEE